MNVVKNIGGLFLLNLVTKYGIFEILDYENKFNPLNSRYSRHKL